MKFDLGNTTVFLSEPPHSCKPILSWASVWACTTSQFSQCSNLWHSWLGMGESHPLCIWCHYQSCCDPNAFFELTFQMFIAIQCWFTHNCTWTKTHLTLHVLLGMHSIFELWQLWGCQVFHWVSSQMACHEWQFDTILESFDCFAKLLTHVPLGAHNPCQCLFFSFTSSHID